jgi:Xaa-Pro aminopeptidase
MKKGLIVLTIILIISVCAGAQELQRHFTPEEFAARWQTIFEQTGDQAVAIVQGLPDSGGYIFPRQSNNLYYLCGVNNPHTYIVLDGKNKEVTIYLKEFGHPQDVRELSLADIDQVKRLTGAHHVKNLDDFELPTTRQIYVPFSPLEGHAQQRWEMNHRASWILEDPLDGRLSRSQQLIAKLRIKYPRAELHNLTPILDEMRKIKSEREIELIRRASRMTAIAINEAIKTTKAGMYEYQLEAAAKYVYAVNGSMMHGYRSITAAGVKNTSNGHYYYSSSQLKNGDMVLMDCAADYGNYTSDIGRMWPVNGKYEPWQRELLQIITIYHKEIIKRIRPGVSREEIMAEAAVVMAPILDNYKFSKPIYEAAARKMVDTGGGVFSHPVGLAVHDTGGYGGRPLPVGLVIAIDPQLRVPEENLYMRVEDTIVVTKDGVENLTGEAVLELDEIEALVGSGGMVQDYKPVLKPLVIK